ncbi:hypothetical protein F0562_006780 [Nyssa sinensis]|uniref:Amino acid transporter transmembrane domain-containing protein n=1 Tax=Nyssa sinensis TaxID=561372 RepID=A0A5J5APG0_9ASTE|nr:hypothetical protein F0562_006780 [Nyssa sinensis]
MGFEKEASSSSHVLQEPSFPREDTPLLSKSRHRSSQFKTFANVFISVVGAGVLGLPYTFKKTGWVMGTLMLFSVAFLTYYCMMLLVHTRRKLESRHGFTKIGSFGDLGFAVCGPVGRFTVDAMIVLSQAGFCVGYLIFISNTLAYVFNYSSTDLNPRILGFSPKSFYIWSCFPFQLGLNSIPSLTHLAPLSIFADIVDIGAMGVVMVEDVVIFLKQKPVLQAFGGFSVFFYGLGVAVYAFEGIGMALPLESEMREQSKFGKILGFSMAFISLLYGSFGIMGYFAFGEETKDIITTNFGRGLVSSLVQLGLCVNLFFTFPPMMNPVYEVVERRFCEASVCIVLGFVLPALFHLLVHKEELGWKGFALDGAIVVLGLVFGISGTWSSLQEIFAAKASA